MEGGDDHQSLSSGNTANNGSSSSSGSRWNPTKEQINMLESFYRQGLRTPSAEQIQQITARLRAYGHIEGKNVFYWFQNHKARQRQKQKQETINLAYFNRFLNPLPPAAFAPFPNATVCPPYYTSPSKNDLSFYHHHHYPKVQPPAAATCLTVDFNRRSPSTQAEGYNKAMHHRPIAKIDDHHHASSVQKQTNDHHHHHHHHHQETLDLFPIHPTGVLSKKIDTSHEDYGNENKSCYSYDEEGSTQFGENDAGGYPFIDFFCRK